MSNNSGKLLLLLAVAASAFATNPDEGSFRRYLEQSMKEEGGSSWLERKVVSTLTALVYERRDFKFFSIIRVPENGVTYLGAFGFWIPLPQISQ